MDARIIAVNHAKGIIATYWEFDFELANGNGKEFEGTISLDEAVQFANRPDLGPVADMCRAIKSTRQLNLAGSSAASSRLSPDLQRVAPTALQMPSPCGTSFADARYPCGMA
jgi:hypothetical protein